MEERGREPRSAAEAPRSSEQELPRTPAEQASTLGPPANPNPNPSPNPNPNPSPNPNPDPNPKPKPKPNPTSEQLRRQRDGLKEQLAAAEGQAREAEATLLQRLDRMEEMQLAEAVAAEVEAAEIDELREGPAGVADSSG